MENQPVSHPSPPPILSASARMSILHQLAPLASDLTGAQLEPFSARLSDTLFKRSSQAVRPHEAGLALQAFHHLKDNRASFCRAVSIGLAELLRREIQTIEKGGKFQFEEGEPDLSLVTFDEMENRMLIGSICQAIEADQAEILAAFNLRMADLLQREELAVAHNPFRPGVFLQAVYEAWCAFDAHPESRSLVLRLLRPDVFLQLQPILRALNEALMAQGVLPNLSAAYRSKPGAKKTGSAGYDKEPASAEAERRGRSLYRKLQHWLSVAAKMPAEGAIEAPPRGGYADAADPSIEPAWFGYLNAQQTQKREPAAAPSSATVLRQVLEQAPPGTLTAHDRSKIALLAKIFDYVFDERNIPPAIKSLIGELQIPLMKAALIDGDFFFQEQHPARRLIETLAQSSVAWDQEKGRDDPLYKMIERTVERVQLEFQQQIELFSDVVDDLESFIADEERSSERALSGPIAEAIRQERMRQAQALAERDVAARIETGEVAGFVEVFLETQWTRILTLAHSVADSKPDALAQALKAMDDLIWSVKPKSSPEERKELVSKLPAMLSMVNAWLNVIDWEGPERVRFFSSLVERHAAMVRVQLELSPRRQVELAVNVAQKASERRLSLRAKELEERPLDGFGHMVERIACGQWVEFSRPNGGRVKFKLAWISPQRSRFIFTNRLGHDALSFTAPELAQALRERQAGLVSLASVVERALAVALEEIEV